MDRRLSWEELIATGQVKNNFPGMFAEEERRKVDGSEGVYKGQKWTADILC